MSIARVFRPIFVLGFALALICGGALHAQSVPPQLTGKYSVYDDATKDLIVTGDARLVLDGTVITADEIRFNTATQTASARGHLVLTSGARRVVADEGTYHTPSGHLSFRNLRVGQYPINITGESVEGTLDELILTNATVFFREQASYTPSVTATKLTYAKGKIVRAEGLNVGFLGGHFLQLPQFEHTLDVDFISYVSAHVGYRGNLGALLELGLQLPVAEGVKLGADLGLYSERGVMIGPSGTYHRADATDMIDGFFRSGYINDSGDLGTDILGDPVPGERAFISWAHRQNYGAHFTLNGEFNYWSDSEVLRDFRSNEFNRVQQPDSFIEALYTNANSSFSAFARFHPNPYHRVQERLPELRFDLFPVAAPLGTYHRLNASAAVLQSDAYGTDPSLRTTRLDAYYGLERPIALSPWFTFSPVAGGRVTYYTDALNGKNDYTRVIGEVGFDARLLASGTFDTKSEIWEIDGLRHLIEPKLSYRYAPEAAQGRAYIPPIDRRVFSTYLQPLSIGDSRNLDDLTALNTVRLSFNNTLQTRETQYGSRNLAALNFAADYRFDPALGQRNLSDIFTEFVLTPAPWLRWEVFHRLDPHAPRVQELNTGLTLLDQEWWSLRLATHFLRDEYDEYFLEYRQRLNESFDLTGLWRYDAHNRRFNEQSYGVWQRLGQTWAVKYEVSLFDGPRRESAFSLHIEIELLKF